jgi:phage terminase small subunit
MTEQQPTVHEQYMAALAGLTVKQRDFVEQYLICLNASEAARRAKYSERTAGSMGHENLKKPEIAAAISAGFALRAMPADEVLARLADMARGSADDFVAVHPSPLTTIDGEPIKDVQGNPIVRSFPSLDLEKARERGMLHLIKKVSYTAHGPSVELYDAQAALALLAKHHALLVERLEHSGPGGKSLFPDFEQALEKTYADGDAPTTE